ncbi:hypothetical protein C8Q77DRAFT_710125 [Trametes polyzona]|nr:hypothetical protein C8Q77DRAFT_710125 [Trametes polyzona]
MRQSRTLVPRPELGQPEPAPRGGTADASPRTARFSSSLLVCGWHMERSGPLGVRLCRSRWIMMRPSARIFELHYHEVAPGVLLDHPAREAGQIGSRARLVRRRPFARSSSSEVIGVQRSGTLGYLHTAHSQTCRPSTASWTPMRSTQWTACKLVTHATAKTSTAAAIEGIPYGLCTTTSGVSRPGLTRSQRNVGDVARRMALERRLLDALSSARPIACGGCRRASTHRPSGDRDWAQTHPPRPGQRTPPSWA